MDIRDFIERSINGEIGDMVSVMANKEEVKNFLIFLTINTAAIETAIRRYRKSMDPVDVLGLENSVELGKMIIKMLSIVCSVSSEDLSQDVKKFIEDSSKGINGDVQTHMNKSGENFDTFVQQVFGNKDT